MTEQATSFTLSDAERATFEAQWNKHPGMQHMGVRVDLSKPDVLRAYVDPVLPHHRGGLGTEAVNGSVIAGVFDLAIGLVGHFAARGKRVGTAQLNIQFIRPVNGDRFDAYARLVRAGRTLVFAEGDLFDQGGMLCARCDGIVAIIGEPAAPGEGKAL